ncbi:DUF648 domain-containing protein [Chlamydia vaughanii]|uniref:DUF648 domain-containing protein n=1 Tax=Chlamydia vaughanii TaxID=3112552 RepID=UPI0032B0FD72
MLNPVTFSSGYVPSIAERMSSRLDSYFYLGGEQIKVLDKSTKLGLRFAIHTHGRNVSVIEKVLKILSWIFIPLVIFAWLLHKALHTYLHFKYPCLYLDTPISKYLEKEIVYTLQAIHKIKSSQTILTSDREIKGCIQAEGIFLDESDQESEEINEVIQNSLMGRFSTDFKPSYKFHFINPRTSYDRICNDLHNLIHNGRNLINGSYLSRNASIASIEKQLDTTLGIKAKISRLPKKENFNQGLKATFSFLEYPEYTCILTDDSVRLNKKNPTLEDEYRQTAMAKFIKRTCEARQGEETEKNSYLSWPKYVGCCLAADVVILDEEESDRKILSTDVQGSTSTNLSLFSSQAFVQCYKAMKKHLIVPYSQGKEAAFTLQERYKLIMSESGSYLPLDSTENRRSAMTAFLRQVPRAFLRDVLSAMDASDVALALPSIDYVKLAHAIDLIPIVLPGKHILSNFPQASRCSSDKELKLALIINFIQEILDNETNEEVFIPYKNVDEQQNLSTNTLWGDLAYSPVSSLTGGVLCQLEKMHVISSYTTVQRGVFIRVNR